MAQREVGIDPQIQGIGGAVFGGQEGGEGDHGGVVGGEGGGSELDFETSVCRCFDELALEGLVAGDPAGKGDGLMAGVLGGFDCFFDKSLGVAHLNRGDAGFASRLASDAGISSRCRSWAHSDDLAIPLLQIPHLRLLSPFLAHPF